MSLEQYKRTSLKDKINAAPVKESVVAKFKKVVKKVTSKKKK